MKRLTETDRYWEEDAFWYDAKEPDVEDIEKIYNRLAAIEDILGDEYELDDLKTAMWCKETVGMAFSEDTAPVERLRELWFADKDGRCVVLPCKVGDTVYFITGIHGSLVKPAKVEEIYIGDGSTALGVSTDFTTFTLQESEWFLTRTEAEAALKTRKQE